MRDAGRRPMGRLCYWALTVLACCGLTVLADAQSGPTTTISDTVYLADGAPAQGTLIITWPAFETASGSAIAAGSMNVTLGTGGALSVALAPNAGATPAGVYYTVVYQLGPSEVKTEYWMVPVSSTSVNLAAVVTTPGSGVAAQPVSAQYVNSALAAKANDNAVVHLANTETITGVKTFNAAPNVPAPVNPGDVANKSYVDTSVSNVGSGVYLPTAGGTMSGPITLSANPAAPLQAATKQYVDTGLAGKANVVSGVVPASQLGTGSATTGSCLLGNGASASWGTCGGGSGAGNVSTTPVANQTIAQPAGTQFSTNNLANIRYVTSSWNWAQTPSDSLTTVGSNTIHLAPCPLGLDTASSANYYSYKVYIAGTGTPEAALVTGGSCTPGAASGSITVTTTNTHTAGYTVGSASTGIQEAWNDAWVNDAGAGPNASSLTAPYVKLVANTQYNIYASVYMRGRGGVLDGAGAFVVCGTRDRCIYVGVTGAFPNTTYHHLYNLTGTSTLTVDGAQVASVSASGGVYTVTTATTHPFVAGDMVDCEYHTQTADQHWMSQVLSAGLTGTSFEVSFGLNTFAAGANAFGFCNIENAFIEDNSDHAIIADLALMQANPSGPGYFTYGVINDNDQQLQIERATNRGSSITNPSGTHFPATWPLGAFVYGRADQGNSGITYIHNGEFTNVNCATAGGNGFVVENTVCQAFPMYAFRYFGGLQPATFTNIYQETAPGLFNPLYSGSYPAQMGYLLQSSQPLRVVGTWPTQSQTPVFATGGSTVVSYFVVPRSSNFGYGPVLFAGSAMSTGTGSITVQWPSVELVNSLQQSLGTLTWDVVKTTGANTAAPNPSAGGILVAQNVSGSCTTGGICSAVDAQSSSTPYSVQVQQFTPVFWWWPVNYAINNGVLEADRISTQEPIVATQGITGVGVIAQSCDGAGYGVTQQRSPIEVTCLGVSTANAGGVATVLRQLDASNNGPAANDKGRLNFGKTITAPNDIITLVDSNLAKTESTFGERPANDVGDVALGIDQTGGLSQRAPISISSYVNATPNGTNYLERLTTAAKTFNVPVTVNGNVTATGTINTGMTGGPFCVHETNGVLSATSADCGSGSGGGSGSGTVNSGAATQIAFYSASTAAVSGDSNLTDNGTTLTYRGSTVSTSGCVDPVVAGGLSTASDLGAVWANIFSTYGSGVCIDMTNATATDAVTGMPGVYYAQTNPFANVAPAFEVKIVLNCNTIIVSSVMWQTPYGAKTVQGCVGPVGNLTNGQGSVFFLPCVANGLGYNSSGCGPNNYATFLSSYPAGYNWVGGGPLTPTTYTTGTATFTNGSATVTGTGTSWSAAAMQGGFIQTGTDGSAPCVFHIKTVVSSTSITLDGNYSASGCTPASTSGVAGVYTIYEPNINVLIADGALSSLGNSAFGHVYRDVITSCEGLPNCVNFWTFAEERSDFSNVLAKADVFCGATGFTGCTPAQTLTGLMLDRSYTSGAQSGTSDYSISGFGFSLGAVGVGHSSNPGPFGIVIEGFSITKGNRSPCLADIENSGVADAISGRAGALLDSAIWVDGCQGGTFNLADTNYFNNGITIGPANTTTGVHVLAANSQNLSAGATIVNLGASSYGAALESITYGGSGVNLVVDNQNGCNGGAAPCTVTTTNTTASQTLTRYDQNQIYTQSLSAASGTFSGNLTVNGQLLVAGPWIVSSPIPGTAMGAAGAGTSSLGISNDGNFYISANAGTPQKVATTATSSYFSNLTQEDGNDVGQFTVGETAAQNLHVYSAYSSSSSWQRTTLGFDTTDGYAVVKSENSTSGTAPGLGFWINNGLKWVIDQGSNLKPWADDASNIGSFSGSTGIGLRPATVFAAGNTNSDSGFELGKFANTSYEICNDTATGTVLNGLAVLTADTISGTSTGCAVKPTSAVTSGVIGVVIASAGASGTATLVRTGSAYCSFDTTATVVGDYVVPSSVSGSYFACHDAGSTLPNGAQVLGRVLQATAGGVTAQMFFDMPGSSAGPSQVSSIFGRTGTVTAQSGDYSVGQVTGAAPLASPTFTGTPAAPTAAASTTTTQIATTAFAHGVVPPDAASSVWITVPHASTSGTVFSTSSNKAAFFGVMLGYQKTTSQVGYYVATQDTSSTTYDLGIYSGTSGGTCTLQAHTGSIAGSTAMTSGAHTVSWTGGSVTLQPGRYYLALTASASSSTAVLYGDSAGVTFAGGTGTGNVGNVSVSSGGTLPASVTCPTDSVQVAALIPAWLVD